MCTDSGQSPLRIPCRLRQCRREPIDFVWFCDICGFVNFRMLFCFPCFNKNTMVCAILFNIFPLKYHKCGLAVWPFTSFHQFSGTCEKQAAVQQDAEGPPKKTVGPSRFFMSMCCLGTSSPFWTCRQIMYIYIYILYRYLIYIYIYISYYRLYIYIIIL